MGDLNAHIANNAVERHIPIIQYTLPIPFDSTLVLELHLVLEQDEQYFSISSVIAYARLTKFSAMDCSTMLDISPPTSTIELPL